jgi:hypothetical protein
MLVSTRAITIAAPVTDVWPWLLQLGQGRGGFYSYAWLENLFGCEISNADSILPEHQDLSVGDGIHLHPDSPPVPVLALESERLLLLAGRINPRNGEIVPLDGFPGGEHLPTSWAFILRPLGPRETRLIVRFRLAAARGPLFWLAYRFLLEPATFIMERRMMLGIRDRAEACVGTHGEGLSP